MMNRTPWFLTFLLASAGTLFGCPEDDGPGPATLEPVSVIESALERDEGPDVAPDDFSTLIGDNTTFGFDLLAEVSKTSDDNLMISPHSISTALAMTYAGANGETKAEMADALRFTLDEATLHPAFNLLDQELNSRGEGAQGADGGAFRLKTINALWGQAGFPFVNAFLDTIKVNYGAGIHAVDFESDPEAARLLINDWVAQQTEDRIPELIPEKVITPLTKLVLTNAVYFNAAWKFVFQTAVPGTFNLLDGTTVQADMMTQDEGLPYAKESGAWTAVRLPYSGNQLAMTIIMPDAGQFDAVQMDGALLDEVRSKLQQQQVLLTMPKYEFRSKFSLVEMMEALGMKLAFQPSIADLSGIDGPASDLHIQDIIHEGFVRTDEKGTEAAAATAVVVGDASAPPPGIPLALDRPFYFAIEDLQTGSVVFVGRIMDPTKE